MAKKYNDVEELQKDNSIQIFFDEKYDDTPYDIGQAWMEERGIDAEGAESVITGLSEFLIQNNGILNYLPENLLLLLGYFQCHKEESRLNLKELKTKVVRKI